MKDILFIMPENGHCRGRLTEESGDGVILEYAGRIATVRPPSVNRVFLVSLYKLTDTVRVISNIVNVFFNGLFRLIGTVDYPLLKANMKSYISQDF